jgi:hypothetical protein
MPEKTALSATELLMELVPEESCQHGECGNPGWYDYAIDPATGLLTIEYDASETADHASTTAVFRLVTIGISDDIDEDDDDDDDDRDDRDDEDDDGDDGDVQL